MATLAESLTIKIDADTKGLEKGIETAKKKTKAASTSMSQSLGATVNKLDEVKAGWEKLKGVLVFSTAAIAAAAVPTLKAEDAIKKLAGATLLAGKNLDKTMSGAKAAADKFGLTYSKAARAATVAIATGAADAKTAVESLKASMTLEKLGFGSAQAIQGALERGAKAFQVPLEQIQEMGVGASVLGAGAFEQIINAAVDLKPAMEESGVSFEQFVETMSTLQSRGAPFASSLALVSQMMTDVRTGNQEAIQALNHFGAGIDTVQPRLDNMQSVLALVTQGVVGGGQAMTDALGPYQAYADTLKGLGSDGASQFVAGMGAMKDVVTDFTGAIDASQSSLDQLATLLANLINQITGWTKSAKTMLVDFAQSIVDLGNSIPGFAATSEFLFGGSMHVGTMPVLHKAAGGEIPGVGNTDSVPAMLTPGEIVINKKVAQALKPMLLELNRSGIDSSSLHNTLLAGTSIKGRSLLGDVLGIQPAQRAAFSLGSFGDSGMGHRNATLAAVASDMMRAIGALQLNKGGEVPSVSNNNSRSFSIQNVNISARASLPDIRRQLMPEIERIAERRQSFRGRTGR